MPKSSHPAPAVPRAKALTPHEALIYVMIMASAVDRVMSDIELEQIGLIIKRQPAFEGFDKKRLVKIAQDCGGVLARDDGFKSAVDLIGRSLAPELRETAYAYAVEVMAADRTVNLEEVRLLDILAEQFEMTDLATSAIKFSAEARHRSLQDIAPV